MKKIGLIGYFGAGAFSDDLIEYVTKQLFSGFRDDLVFDSNVLKKCAAGTDIRYLNSFDLLVHCGGSLLGKCTHPPINSIELWASQLKIPFAIFGLGYRLEPDKEPLNAGQRRRIEVLFEKAEVISLRGYRTKRWLSRNKISTRKVSSYADPVIACEWDLKQIPTHIMGNVRNMPDAEIQHVSTDRGHRFMAECYDWLIDYFKKPLNLICFRHAPGDSDLLGAEKVKALMKHKDKVAILVPNDFREAFDYMRNAAFWFGQRLHPTIFAAAHQIPFVGLEYQFEKMMDFMSTILCKNYVDMREASLEAFKEKFLQGSYWVDRIPIHMKLKKKEVVATAQKIMELL